MSKQKLNQVFDTFLEPVEAPFVMLCLFLGGLVLIVPAAILRVPLGILTIVLVVYVVTSPFWIYEIISTKNGDSTERWTLDVLRKIHLDKTIL